MPPHISTEFFSKSSITAILIFVLSDIFSIDMPEASRAMVNADFSTISMPYLLGDI